VNGEMRELLLGLGLGTGSAKVVAYDVGSFAPVAPVTGPRLLVHRSYQLRSEAGSTVAAPGDPRATATTRSKEFSGRCSVVRTIQQNAFERRTYWSDGRRPLQGI
jgi:hypothetical protein